MFEFFWLNISLQVRCSSKFNSIGNIITVDDRNKRNSVAEKLSDSNLFSPVQTRPRRSPDEDLSYNTSTTITCNKLQIPLTLMSEPNTFSTNVSKIYHITHFTISYWMSYALYLINILFYIVYCAYQAWRWGRHVQSLFPSLFQGRYSTSTYKHYCKFNSVKKIINF